MLFVLTAGGTVSGEEDILPLEDIESGMQGRAKTVFRGTEVEEFPVEIIDILYDQGVNSDLILVRAGGEKVEELGGIAAGMSGSPVYVDDKLVGAISRGWQDSRGNYCLVTPIEEMLSLIEDGGGQNREFQSSKPEMDAPLIINGLGGRSFKRLREELSEYDLEVVNGSGASSGQHPVEEEGKLEPGSAIAAQLVRGDVNVSSLGTLTYIDENKLLAYGHPIMNMGEIGFLLTEANISESIPSEQQPFKIGVPGERLLGVIYEDRGAGIAGELKKYPPIIPLTVKVTDHQRDESEKVMVQLVKEEKLLTSLASNIALESIDSTLDRIGKGTAEVEMNIMANGLPDLEVKHENMFYSREDIASSSLVDFYELLELLTANPFSEVSFIDMEMKIDIYNQDRVALVQEAKIKNDKIVPGDTLDIEVTLRPYRDEAFKEEIALELPDDIKPGMANLVISGGFMGQQQEIPDPEEEPGGEENKEVVIESYTSLEEILADFKERPKNNHLQLFVYPSQSGNEGPPAEGMEPEPETEQQQSQPEQQQEEESPAAEEQPQAEDAEIRKDVKTDYVLEGTLDLNFEVEEKQEGEE
ncbi:MAG: SpoIVB peptidase S55 domain-containing protein [Halanaerobiaceae bacterium]